MVCPRRHFNGACAQRSATEPFFLTTNSEESRGLAARLEVIKYGRLVGEFRIPEPFKSLGRMRVAYALLWRPTGKDADGPHFGTRYMERCTFSTEPGVTPRREHSELLVAKLDEKRPRKHLRKSLGFAVVIIDVIYYYVMWTDNGNRLLGTDIGRQEGNIQ